MVAADEDHGQVRRRTDGIEHVADDLGGGLGRHRVLGQGGGGSPHGQPAGGSSVKGTTVTGPRSMRQWASTVS